MPVKAGKDLRYVTDYRVGPAHAASRAAKRRLIALAQVRLKPGKSDIRSVLRTRIAKLDFLTFWHIAPHYTVSEISSASPEDWQKEEELFLTLDETPPDGYWEILWNCLSGELQPLFDKEYEKETGQCMGERGLEAKNGVDEAVKNGEVSGPETELAKLDTAFKRAETTPADVNKFGEPVAGHLNKHRKAIINSKATYKGKLGQAVGNEEVLRHFARLSQKHKEITEQLKRSGADLEEFGRELQSCVDSLTPAQASAPESAGS